jgi:hypothetical protein
MILSCPGCGCRFSLEAGVSDEAARHFSAHCLGIPASLKEPVTRYLTLFRPGKNALSWPRAVKTIGELEVLIAAGTVTRNGKTYATPPEVWKKAMEICLENRDFGKLKTPLKGHGYILEVLAGLGEQVEARAEAKQERERQTPRGQRQGAADVQEHLAKLKQATGRLK